MIQRLKNAASRLLGRSTPSKNGRNWTQKWGRPGYNAEWLTHAIPQPVQDAMDDGFYSPGQTLLEVGCGRGDIAAFLADKGMIVTATDFAPTAIELARSKFAEKPGRLQFGVLDACGKAYPYGTFDCGFERGCFHGITNEKDRARYARNMAASITAGGHFLMLHKTGEGSDIDGNAQETREMIARVFGPYFDEAGHSPVTMFSNSEREMSGIAVRMRRKQAG